MGAVTTVTLPPTPDQADVLARGTLALGGRVDTDAFSIHHTLHAGVYTRTARVKAGASILGALIKIPTTLVVTGHCVVNAGLLPVTLTGVNVLTAAAGRRQFFGAMGDTTITMIFRTNASTVREAEQEFTDEWEVLATTPLDTHNITGEFVCQE